MTLIVAGCGSTADVEEAERSDRGPLGKSEAVGTCEEACGGQSAGACWCDEECSDYGDCCSDYEATCLPSAGRGVPLAQCVLRAEDGGPSPVEPSELDDAFARAVLRGEGPCPMTLQDVLEALRSDYDEHCEGYVADQGLSMLVVSERAQITGRAADSRGVIARRCGSPAVPDIFGLVFDFEALDDGSFSEEIPAGLEFIAPDLEQGVFNFYALVDGAWTYFGDSRDMVAEGAQDEILCARCHVSGGLVMREKAQPWPHWGSEFSERQLPGEAQLRDQFPWLPMAGGPGYSGPGANAAGLVHRANNSWAEGRIEHFRDSRTTRALLEPLFCGTDFNVVSEGYRGNFTNNSSFEVRCPPDEPSCEFHGVSTQLFLPEAQLLSSRSWFVLDAYFDVVADNGQRMVERYPDGPPLVHEDGAMVFDNPFGVLYPVPGHIDNVHLWSLEERGLLGRDFITDTLMVDFTRPVFSKARCGLLDYVPELGPDFTPEALKAAMIGALASADPRSLDASEAAYLRALKDPDDGPVHAARLEDYQRACGLRSLEDGVEFTRDVLSYVSLLRDAIRDVPMMRGSENLPVDNLDVHPNAHFDPATCELVVD